MTKENFEGSRPNDQEEVQNVNPVSTEEPQTPKISGWLSFFLWFGVGVGAAASVVMMVVSLANSGASAGYALLAMGQMACLVAVAIMTIMAFYKRKENAVALALTYVAMIALDGLLSLVISIMVDDYSDLKSTLRQFVWAGIWGTFVCTSVQVKELIPSALRVWKPLEKWLLGAYVATEVLVMVILTGAPTFVLSNQKLMEMAVENLNAELNESTLSDVYIVDIRLENNELIYTICINTIEKADCDEERMEKRSAVTKYVILSDLDADSYEELETFLDNGCGVGMEYVDRNYDFLYAVHIPADEYIQACLSDGAYRCPTSVIDSMIGAYADTFPVKHVGGCMLESIVYDDVLNELTYTIRLPEMDINRLQTGMTAANLTNFVHENWSAYEDHIADLAEINHATICERFLTFEGQEHVVVRITPEEYLLEE